ncbi:hypothetical protein GO495_14525 [Chitinophaga oryziterrae]|uniref:Uncharacterized protein n=1 Tax=Chitinophaga oryziterrae TaxID=1031224 RepID=A0A6N8JCG3_9BACT|nr:hypothetical protein [Chitinophaga oryziterrae]MVT41802.1 hypothetical protein [Chitinophaga oryziterrae]
MSKLTKYYGEITNLTNGDMTIDSLFAENWVEKTKKNNFKTGLRSTIITIFDELSFWIDNIIDREYSLTVTFEFEKQGYLVNKLIPKGLLYGLKFRDKTIVGLQMTNSTQSKDMATLLFAAHPGIPFYTFDDLILTDIDSFDELGLFVQKLKKKFKIDKVSFDLPENIIENGSPKFYN